MCIRDRSTGEPCSRVESCIRVLERLAEDALEAGHVAQATALTDGVLTQAEYAEAFDRLASCIGELGLPSSTQSFAVVADDSEEADAVLSCYDLELRLIEEAVGLQNAALSIEQFDE